MYLKRLLKTFKPLLKPKKKVFAALPLFGLIIVNINCGRIWGNIAYLNQPSQSFLGYIISAWLFIDGNGVNGINVNPANNAFTINFDSYNGNLYGTWQESANVFANPYEVRAAVYAGNGGWNFIDGGTSAVGLNYNSATSASNPSSTVANNQLFVGWSEADASNNIRVVVYNGGSSWSFVDGGTANGINYNPTGFATNPNLANFKGQLCASWTEFGASAFLIRAKCYNSGSSWSFIDGGTALGLNQSQTMNADDSFLAVHNNQLYATWVENNQVRVDRYNGSGSWSFIDGGTAVGINRNSAQTISAGPHLISCQGSLFATWGENNGTASQIRVASYAGGSTWNFIDGGGTTGLNHNTNQGAGGPALACFGTYLYLTWNESNGTVIQVRASAYNGTQWISVDGNGVNGLNHNTANGGGGGEAFGILNNVLYLGWSEGLDIRMTVGH